MATETVFAVCMARDEADIIAATVERMRRHVDHVIVADNMSSDGTGTLAAEAGAEVVADPDPAYHQGDKMTALAMRAAAAGADWVVPFDADEVWQPVDGGTLRDTLSGLDSDTAFAELFNYLPTGVDDVSVADPVLRMRWRHRDPGVLGKVAVRPRDGLVIQMGNHAATYGGLPPRQAHGLLRVNHYPYRGRDQFVRKIRQGAAALRAARLHRSVGLHWREYDAAGDDATVARLFVDRFYIDDPVAAPHMLEDAVQ